MEDFWLNFIAIIIDKFVCKFAIIFLQFFKKTIIHNHLFFVVFFAFYTNLTIIFIFFNNIFCKIKSQRNSLAFYLIYFSKNGLAESIIKSKYFLGFCLICDELIETFFRSGSSKTYSLSLNHFLYPSIYLLSLPKM